MYLHETFEQQRREKNSVPLKFGRATSRWTSICSICVHERRVTSSRFGETRHSKCFFPICCEWFIHSVVSVDCRLFRLFFLLWISAKFTPALPELKSRLAFRISYEKNVIQRVFFFSCLFYFWKNWKQKINSLSEERDTQTHCDKLRTVAIDSVVVALLLLFLVAHVRVCTWKIVRTLKTEHRRRPTASMKLDHKSDLIFAPCVECMERVCSP